MSHYALLIGTPESWSESQVQMLADRLMLEALPESVSVAYAYADLVEVPFTAVLVRPLTEPEDD